MASNTQGAESFPDVGVEDWRQRVSEELGGESAASLGRTIVDGPHLEPLYTADDRPPGPPPHLTRRSAAAAALCTVVEAHSPRSVAACVREDLAGGADGIWLRLDRTVRLGRDPTAAASSGMAPDGARLHHGSDLAAALGDGAPAAGSLGSLWIDAGANALPWAALWLADCERCGRDPATVETHFGADPLGALARDGSLPRDLMKLSSEMAALVRFTVRHLPASTGVTVSTAVYEEAGADMPLQLGLMVATLLDYLRGLEESGLSADEASRAVSLRLAVGPVIFPEIAKLRAARWLWTAALGAAGVAGPPPALVHVVGSRRSLTRREPALNLLRASEQAFVAICGGADALSVWGFDAVAGGAGSSRSDSGPLARRLARNTGLILEREGALGRVEDPAAGSFYVEAVTRRLAEQGWAIAQRIEREGGMRHALPSGLVGEMVGRSADARRRALESGETALAGVTRYMDETAGPPDEAERAPAADEAREAAVERLAEHRKSWRPDAGEAVAERSTGGRRAYSRDFVVEELVGAAGEGETVWELGARLGTAEGAETARALGLRRDAEPFESAEGVGEAR